MAGGGRRCVLPIDTSRLQFLVVAGAEQLKKFEDGKPREAWAPRVDTNGPRLADAREQFVAAAREGVALNKWGRRYRRRAGQDLESSLRRVPDELARRRLGDVTRGDVQRLVDDMTRAGAVGLARAERRQRAAVAVPVGAGPRAGRPRPGRASCACRRWTPSRAIGSRRRRSSRSCSPRCTLEDALPCALAAYATARKQEIRDARLAARRPEARRRRAGRRRGGAQAGRLVARRPAGQAAARDAARGVDRAGPAERGQGLPAAAAQRRPGCSTLGYVQERVHARGASSAWSRSACTSRGTPRRRGSTTPASRRRSPRR